MIIGPYITPITPKSKKSTEALTRASLLAQVINGGVHAGNFLAFQAFFRTPKTPKCRGYPGSVYFGGFNMG